MVTLRRNDVAFDASSPTDPHFNVAPLVQESAGWSSRIDRNSWLPPDAKEVTFIVHGYAVSHQEFTTGLNATTRASSR